VERTYESAAALARRAAGPLAAHLGAYAASLTEKRYCIDCVYIKTRQALAFDRWLAAHNVALGDLDESRIVQYQSGGSRRRQSRCAETRCRELCALNQLLHFLRDQGVCRSVRETALPANDVAAGFEHHLRLERGLADRSIERFATTARQFLIARFGTGAVDLRALCAADVVRFVQQQSKRLQPAGTKSVVTGLRSFLRYAQYRGEVDPELVFSVPKVAAWSTTPPLPKAISAEHAQAALDSCDRATSLGRRDRAVLLLLARLGLRAGEIAKLQLDDIDWDSGHLRVRGKDGRECLMPLPVDVGEAIAAYVADGRPNTEDRHLFLRSTAPIRGLKDDSYAIGEIVRRALRRAHVDAPHRGSHQFRHALAVRMLKRGASLAEIGEVLRHRSPQSTSIYARVDVEALRALAPAWPRGAR